MLDRSIKRLSKKARFAETGDLRNDAGVANEILAFFAEHGVLTVAMLDRIIGCPHEEGIDYDGKYCPKCSFWTGRDRMTGKLIA